MTEKLKIVGMHCATCVLTIERVVGGLNGVVSVKANLASNEALVSYDTLRTTLKDIVRAVRNAGYDVYKKEVVLRVDNMTSIDDESIVESKLRKIPGIIDANASHLNKVLLVYINPETVGVEDLMKALTGLGYKASIKSEVSLNEFSTTELNSMLRWSITSLSIGLTLMIFMVGYMFLDIVPAHLHIYAGLIGSTIIMLFPGRGLFTGAFRAFKNRVANMDTLVALGTGSIYIYSLAVTVGLIVGEVYYEAAVLITAFVITGRYLEARIKYSAGEAVKKLVNMNPQEANVLRGGREVRVKVNDVVVGDLVIVRQGERVPVDGIVVKGGAYVDESMLTGELIPKVKNVGSPVHAGSLVVEGWLQVITTRVGGETTLAQIAKLVSQAQAGKLSIQKTVDRVAGWFTWITISVALLTFTSWYLIVGSSLETSLIYTASVLLVACPCALGLATPTAVVAGVNVAVREGIIVRNVIAVEKASDVELVAFDKTGTLTVGIPYVTSTLPAPGYSEDDVIGLAARAEKWGEHPIAKAIVEEFKNRFGSYPKDPESFESIVGMGVVATVDGESVCVGNAKLMKGFEVNTDILEESALKLVGNGITVIYVSKGSKLVGIIGVGDRVKEGVEEAIRTLKEIGLKTVMLTGDRAEVAKNIAARVGIDEVYYELDPEAKSELIKEFQRKGYKVMMVGDGINDAPSISKADIGVAVGTGADISKEAGDIILIQGDLRKIPVLVRVAKKVRNRIYFNLFWAFIYNITLIPIAAGILTHAGLTLRPEMAAAAMALSSITVTLSSYQLSKWRP